MIIKFNKRNILVIAILFLIFPFVVQFLFYLPSPCSFFEAKWSAGDILTYAGTVFLGVIAIWQNERLREANDASQERLEKLASDANKLSYMAKVVEYELEKKRKLEISIEAFQDACSSQNLISFVSNDKDINLSSLLQIERLLDETYLRLCYSLGMHYDDNAECLNEYKKCVQEMNALSKNVIRIVKENMKEDKKELTEDMTNEIAGTINRLNIKRLEMEKQKEAYLHEKNTKLEYLIYSKDLIVDGINSIY